MSPEVNAGSLSDKDVQIVGRTLGFLDPPVAAGVVAVVYGAGNPASKADAQAIADAFGSGLKAGSATVTASLVDSDKLGDGSGYVALIAATGGAGDKMMNAAKGKKLLCITSDVAQIASGCVMAVHSEPKVEIIVNRANAAAVGVSFAPSFRMMIKEQ